MDTLLKGLNGQGFEGPEYERFESYSYALKSNGTLLPLPALYLFGPLVKSLGRGNCPSSWKRHLRSWTGTRFPLPGAPAPIPGPVGLFIADPPFVSV